MDQEFYRRAGIVIRSIPEGTVTTYGQVALLCGKPKNSRQVGYGLKKNLVGDVPAHRVVNSRGILSGAVHFEMPDLQRMLLADEGVFAEWTEKGWQVDLKQYGWKNTMEDALFLKAQFEEET